MKRSLLVLILLLIVTGCGRKEPPQPMDSTDPPAISSFHYSVTGNTLKIDMKLAGGSQGIGYQIDRAEVDPACDCPGFWRRYLEEPPLAVNMRKSRFTQFISLKDPGMEYAFRVRAIDAPGRLGKWSGTIRVRADARVFD